MNLFGKRLGDINKCSKCGNKLDTDSLFCLKCGTPINPCDDAESGEMVDGKKRCPGCSAMVEEESDLCWNCGYIFATLLKRCPKCNAILTSGRDKCSVCDTIVICEDFNNEEPIIGKILVEAKPKIEETPALHSSIVRPSTETSGIPEERKAASKYFHKPPSL